MRYQIFTEDVQDSYDVAILIKPTSMEVDALNKYYVDTFSDHGIPKEKIIVYSLQYNGGKVRAKEAKEYLAELLPILEDLGVKYIYCADAAYFKLISGQRKAEVNLGYKFDVANTNMIVTLGINYGSIKHNPDNLNKLKLSVQTVKDIINNEFEELGSNIISFSHYPNNSTDISSALMGLRVHPALTCDIECYSLSVVNAGLGTIAFAWDQHSGTAFQVDFATNHKPNHEVRAMLREFFENYEGTLIFHNAGYDVKILIKELFMKDIYDTDGLLHGLEVMTSRLHDTQILAYLATNSAAKPPLNLKYLAHEFAGNYAQDDIKDIRKIGEDNLLKYNLIDCLATWFVFDKFHQQVIDENLYDLYTGLMLDTLRLLIQTEITGLPISAEYVQKAKEELEAIAINSFDVFDSYDEVKETVDNLRQQAVEEANKKLKKTKHDVSMPRYQSIVFNPNSNLHLQELLFNVMELPVLGLTPTKQPATGNDILEKLLSHCTEKQKGLIQAILDYMGVAKILSAFIPAFERACIPGQDISYLRGSFHIGGTVSGRLSSSSPNLQNLPSGSHYGKLIKSCFRAPKGKVFCGADFASLEDRINTLLTKDTNKLAVYTGHEVYSLTIDGVEHTIRDDDKISYNGSTYTGKQLYKLLKGNYD